MIAAITAGEVEATVEQIERLLNESDDPIPVVFPELAGVFDLVSERSINSFLDLIRKHGGDNWGSALDATIVSVLVIGYQLGVRQRDAQAAS